MEIVILLTLLALTHYLTFKAGEQRCVTRLIAYGRVNPNFWDEVKAAGQIR